MAIVPFGGPKLDFLIAAVQVVFRCRCQPSAPVGMLHGVHETAHCPACGREFAIAAVHYDRATHATQVEVQIGTHEPAILRPGS